MVILFTDLAGSTALSAELELEDYAALLEAIRQCLEQAVADYGGTIVRIDGDGALCAFGYPHAEDSVGRDAVNAALRFHELVGALPLPAGTSPIALHSGIHAGLVLVQPGDTVRGVVELLGNTTNVAARLCDHASPGEIWVSEAAIGSDRHLFTVSNREAFRAAGQPDPITILSISGRAAAKQAHEAQFGDTPSPYCGRVADIALIRQWAAQGDTPMLLVHGEAGVGKSRLLHEAQRTLADTNPIMALANCETPHGSRPLQPIQTLAVQLNLANSEASEAADRAARLVHHIRTLSADGRVIIAFDDWQWADAATLHLVDMLLDHAPAGLRILAASRARDPRIAAPGQCARHALDMLPADAARAMITALLPQADPLLITRIIGASGGNALLIEELCRDAPQMLHGPAAPRATFRLSALVQQRLEAMPPDTAAAVQLCAVIGLTIPQWLLRHVLSITAQQTTPDAVTASGFFRVDTVTGDFSFRHGLIRDALYTQLSLRERRDLHQHIVAALLARRATATDAAAWTEALALHRAACDDPLALESAVEAGDRAMKLGSLDRALIQYRSAIDLLARQSGIASTRDLSRLTARYSSAALPDPHVEHLAPLQRMAALAAAATDPAALGKAQLLIASLHYTLGYPTEALRVLDWDDGAHLSRSCPDEPALSEAVVGQSLTLQNHLGQARHHLDRAIDALRHTDDQSRRDSLAYILGMRGQIRGDQGDFPGAFADFAEAERQAGAAPPAMYGSVLSQRAAVHLWAEDYAACRTTMQASREHGDRVGSRYVMMISRALIAYVDCLEAPDDRALATMDVSARWFADTQSRYSLALTLGWCADAARRLGADRQAADYADAAIALRSSGLRWGSTLAWRTKAEVAASNAEARHALRCAYAGARRAASVREWAETRVTHAAIAERHGWSDDVAQLRTEALAVRRAMGLPYFAAVPSPITSPAGIA
jgi:class 3 adenylate cyclase